MFVFIKVFRRIIVAHITQRPLRTVLTVLGVALGVSASVAVRTANVDVLQSFEQAVMTVAGRTTLEVSGGELGLDERLITGLRDLSGVTSASPVILQAAVKSGGGSQRAVQVLGLDLLAEGESRGLSLGRDSSERRLERLIDPKTLFLGRKVAAEWHVSRGDFVDLQVGSGVVTCTIEEVLLDPHDRASSWDYLAVMDIAAAQIMFGMVGRLDRIDLTTEEGANVDAIAQAVRAMVPPDVIVERPSRRTGQVEQMLQAFRLNVTALSWVGLVVGMFLIYNTMAFAVAQRRREIGIYRAVGMTQSRVACLFLAEAAVLGLAGGVVGSGAGFLLAQELVTLMSRTVTDLYAPVGGGTGHILESTWFWTLSTEGMLIGCIVSMFGAIGPSVDAARTAPTRALSPGDYEAGRRLHVGVVSLIGLGLLAATGVMSAAGPVGGVPVFGYGATISLLAGLSCLAPICMTGWRRKGREPRRKAGMQGAIREIAIDHASRNPGRNGVTVSALMVGLAIMIGVLVMVRSFRHTVEIWVDDTVLADIVVAPSLWLRGTEAGSVGRSLPGFWSEVFLSVPEVKAVDTYRDIRVTVQGQRVAIVSRDLRLHARLSRYLTRHGESSEQLIRAADTGGVLVSEILADHLGVEEGHSVEVMTPEGPRRFPIIAVFYDYATDGGKILMDRGLYQSIWQDDLVTVFPVYLTAGADLDRVREEMAVKVREAGGGRFPPLLMSNAELRKEILAIFDRSFLMTYVLEAIAIIIAMLGIVNTLITSVLERRREFATLRAIGGSAGQIRQLVIWEAAYLGLIGIGLGLVGGGVLSFLLITVINKQSFGWTIQMILPLDSLAQAIGLAVAATLLAGYVPARWAAEQPVAEGLREE